MATKPQILPQFANDDKVDMSGEEANTVMMKYHKLVDKIHPHLIMVLMLGSFHKMLKDQPRHKKLEYTTWQTVMKLINFKELGEEDEARLKARHELFVDFFGSMSQFRINRTLVGLMTDLLKDNEIEWTVPQLMRLVNYLSTIPKSAGDFPVLQNRLERRFNKV